MYLKIPVQERSIMNDNPFKKILIIDDDLTFLKPLCKFLTLMKYQVNIAENGLSGLNLHDYIKFDLIITDLKMEGMNGIELINFLLTRYPETKIMVISGHIDLEEFQEIKNNKYVKAIFEKPVDYEQLLKKIKEII